MKQEKRKPIQTTLTHSFINITNKISSFHLNCTSEEILSALMDQKPNQSYWHSHSMCQIT